MSREYRRFGPWTLELPRGLLHHASEIQPVQLEGRILDLLDLLTREPHTLVRYKAIHRHLSRRGKELKEANRRRLLSDLRKLLEDEGPNYKFVQTRHELGLVFCHEVVTLSNTPSEEDPPGPSIPPEKVKVLPERTAATAPTLVNVVNTAEVAEGEQGTDGEAGRGGPVPVEDVPSPVLAPPKERGQEWRKRTGYLTAVVVALLVALGLFFVEIHRTRQKFSIPPPKLSVVVLPLVNRTAIAENEFLADSMTDSIIGQLELMGGTSLRVLSRGTSMSLKHTSERPNQIGSEFGVDYLVEGSLYEDSGRLRVQTTLLRTRDEERVLASTFDTDPQHLLPSSEIFSRNLIQALPLGLEHIENAEAYISPSPAARDAYLRGQHFLWLRTHESLTNALFEFRTALNIDPAYAQAASQLGVTYFLLGGYGWMEQQAAGAAGEQAVRSSLMHQPNLPDAHAAMGYYDWFYRWDLKQAEKELKQAIQGEPSDVNALHWYALVLATEGHVAEAREWMERALAVDPRSEILQTNLGWLDYFGGKLDRSAKTMESVLREDPGFISARLKLLVTYASQGKQEDAFRQLQILSLDDLSPELQTKLQVIHKTGDLTTALCFWLQVERPLHAGNTLIFAELEALSGEDAKAVDLLKQGLKTHDGWMVMVSADPVLQRYHHHPELLPLFERR